MELNNEELKKLAREDEKVLKKKELLASTYRKWDDCSITKQSTLQQYKTLNNQAFIYQD